MKSEDESILWRGHDLSTDTAIMFYHGHCYVRPLARGIVLKDLELTPELDELLPTGEYEIEVRVIRRIGSTNS